MSVHRKPVRAMSLVFLSTAMVAWSPAALGQQDEAAKRLGFGLVQRRVFPPQCMAFMQVRSSGRVTVEVYGLTQEGEPADPPSEHVGPPAVTGNGETLRVKVRAFEKRGIVTPEELQALSKALKAADLTTLRLPPLKTVPKRVERWTDSDGTQNTMTHSASKAREFTLTFYPDRSGAGVVKQTGLWAHYGKASQRFAPVMAVLDRIQARVVGATLEDRLKPYSRRYQDQIEKIAGLNAGWLKDGVRAEQRARRAFELRTRAEETLAKAIRVPRSKARTFARLVERYQTRKGLTGDAVYEAIIESAGRIKGGG